MCSCAYVTLVMRNCKYIAGALVLAFSLRKVQTIYPIICMITEDIDLRAIKVLKRYYDEVIIVPYIRHQCISLRTHRQSQLYNNWIEESFTKWNCIDSNLFHYDKVLFIDADIIMINNCDDQLFSLEPPAMTFSLPWVKPFTVDGIENPYGILSHGQRVDWELVQKGLKSFIGVGSMVLLRPNHKVFLHMLSLLKQKFSYGNLSCYSGFDEQLICQTYVTLEQSFTNIHQCYNWWVGKWNWLPSPSLPTADDADSHLNKDQVSDIYSIPKVYHYYGDKKPWYFSRNDQWTDTKLWWALADDVIKSNDSARKYFELNIKDLS